VNVKGELLGLKMFIDISMLADTLESQIDFLIEIKTAGMKGYCSDRAIDRDFLIDSLHNLEANKVGLGPIFGSWEWREYYKHIMCSVAQNLDEVWMTLRIPMVQKSERLVRIIPTSQLKAVMTKISNYGIDALSFRERSNDNFHLISKGSFDLCNRLGNVKTCSVRDVRFSISQQLVVAVEFARNRLLVVGQNTELVKLTSKCPLGVSEISISLDSVITVPNNCSYISNALSIDIRDSDTAITKEIGIFSVDKIEIDKVQNWNDNDTKLMIGKIAHHVSNMTFENNRKEIERKLAELDTNHKTFGHSYTFDKWTYSGCLGGIIGIIIMIKLIRLWKNRKNQKNQTIVIGSSTERKVDDVELEKIKVELSLAKERAAQIKMETAHDLNRQTFEKLGNATIELEKVKAELSLAKYQVANVKRLSQRPESTLIEGKNLELVNFGLPSDISKF
jgi:hypothetical protein